MTTQTRRRPKTVIGWREWVGLPELGIDAVKVKVDTGARSSALHAFGVMVVEKDGLSYVRFRVHPIQHDSEATAQCELPLHDRRWVTSSNGRTELRPVVRTAVSFEGARWPIDLTLTSRDMMGFRMLLGREAIRRRFMVDPGRSFLGMERASQHRDDGHEDAKAP